MFSGITEDMGVILNVQKDTNCFNIDIKSRFLNELSLGESVAHNGVCLTITNKQKNYYTVNCVNETLKKTTLKNVKKGDYLNLERSLTAATRISGHFVQGHVDCIGKCLYINKEPKNIFFGLQYPKKYQNLIFEKGSICINGVSLTISKIIDSKLLFEVCIIPYTLNHSTFQFLKKNDNVNLEFDLISKQINRRISLSEQ